MKIGLDLALVLIAAARKKAEEIGVPMVIAVVDAGGNPIALHRMDDALLVSINIAANKAYTAVAVKSPPMNSPRSPSRGSLCLASTPLTAAA